MMTTYLISDVTVRDAEAFEAYRTRAAPAIAKFGGRYLVRGGAVTVLEGNRHPTILVVVEFPDRAAAEAWYASAEYGEALKFRDEGLSRSLVLVDGVGV
jgi:uncharacterized protein (DUF1330 family)